MSIDELNAIIMGTTNTFTKKDEMAINSATAHYKTRIALTGVPKSKEHVAKVIKANLGKKLSPERALKLKLSHTGIKQSAETVAKRVNARKGYVPSDETKTKMALASPHRKQVNVDGVIYDTVTDVAKKFNLSKAGVRHRLNSNTPEWKTWNYVGAKPKKCNAIFKQHVLIEKIAYESITDAAKALGMSDSGLDKRIKSNNPLFKNYEIISHEQYLKLTKKKGSI